MLLRATVDDVVASFLNQPVEVGALRRRVTELAGEGVPQLVLRLGYGDAVPSMPRRPVADVLTQAAAPASLPPVIDPELAAVLGALALAHC